MIAKMMLQGAVAAALITGGGMLYATSAGQGAAPPQADDGFWQPVRPRDGGHDHEERRE